MRVDVERVFDQHTKAIWYVCRYGNGQRYEDVVRWPRSRLNRAVEALSFYIEKENPPVSRGGKKG